MGTHFAVLAPPFTSHVRALEALAGELMDRGHRVTWVHMAEVQQLLRDPRTGFAPVGADSHPPGTLARLVARAARPGGPFGISRVIRDVADCTEVLCREAPDVLRRLGVDAVLADQMEAAGGLVARSLGLPFVSVACALPVNREPRLPLPVMPWPWAADPRGLHLNRSSERVYDWMMRSHTRVIERHARRFGLGPHRSLEDCASSLAQVSQTIEAFDFPRAAAPPQLHHVGPLRAPAEAAAPWPPEWQPPPGARFVFASLGTLQGGRLPLLRRIAQACRAEGVAVLVAHCDQLDATQAASLTRAGATWVTGFAPQQEAIARADVVITHAGLNTVMDALHAGKPMLMLPIAFDQPGVAARVVHAGAGLRVMPAFATVATLRAALRQLLADPGFALHARALGMHVREAGGVRHAADIVETAVRTGRSVLRGRAARMQ
ncbi:MAG TPA: glycosyltransferase [Ramlibacter sp.]|nr:glycosyltransferase [Ramlibacter sp.]